MIGPLQITVPDSTKQTNIYAPCEIRTRTPNRRKTLDRADSGIGFILFLDAYIYVLQRVCSRVLGSTALAWYSEVTVIDFLFFLSGALRPNVGYGFLILEFSISHSGVPQSEGLLWTNDQLVAKTTA